MLWGLIVLIFLTFEALVGTSLDILGVKVDSTFIVALLDSAVIYIGIASSGRKKQQDRPESEGIVKNALLQISILLVALLLSSYLIFSAIPNVPWDTVYWFVAEANFELIREHFGIGLFVSQILLGALLLIFVAESLSSEMSEDVKEKD